MILTTFETQSVHFKENNSFVLSGTQSYICSIRDPHPLFFLPQPKVESEKRLIAGRTEWSETIIQARCRTVRFWRKTVLYRWKTLKSSKRFQRGSMRRQIFTGSSNVMMMDP